jgi:AcrR family transcriptional regulator
VRRATLEEFPESPSLPAAPPRSLHERKQLLVKAAIWDAATDLFVEKGYDETTVDEIAVRAGISRRSFFRYFASKNDLMASATAEYAELLAVAIRACPAGSSVPEVVRRTVLQVAQQCTALPRTRKVMQILSAYPSATVALKSRAGELRQKVQEAFDSRGGAFRDLAPGVLAELTLAVLDIVFHFWFRQGEQDIGDAVDRVFATLGHMAFAELPGSRQRRRRAES